MILVTGCAGFIGYHITHRLLKDGHAVRGIDNVNDYYDVGLKRARLKGLYQFPKFSFDEIDLADAPVVDRIFEASKPTGVVHLAAQAGVRYSIENPRAYAHSNLTGFVNVLEGCRAQKVKHLVFASSSSVYGLNTTMPFSVHQNVDHPVSLYAATKKANELMAHSYAHNFKLPVTGLRFFTVYGPWGRPDMALFSFTKAIIEGRPIDIYNQGKMLRDFTFVDDIVEGVVRILAQPATPNPHWSGHDPDCGSSLAPYRLYNIGSNSPVELMRFVEILEDKLGKRAIKRFLPVQSAEVPASYADVSDLQEAVDFRPSTPLDTGIERFLDWYRAYYGT